MDGQPLGPAIPELHSFALNVNQSMAIVKNSSDVFDQFHRPLSAIVYQQITELIPKLGQIDNAEDHWTYSWKSPQLSTKRMYIILCLEGYRKEPTELGIRYSFGYCYMIESTPEVYSKESPFSCPHMTVCSAMTKLKKLSTICFGIVLLLIHARIRSLQTDSKVSLFLMRCCSLSKFSHGRLPWIL